MLLLLLFAFIAGFITILSPCILPILPIVLSGSLTGGKRRPYGIVTGFIFSFTFFTLALATIVKVTGLPPDILRTIAIIAIGFFGISLLLPQTQVLLEKIISRFSSLLPNTQTQDGFGGGIVIGLSLGLLWAPCVGPILASVITLALTSSVTLTAVLITAAYAIGTAIPMLAVIQGGRHLLHRVPWLLSNSAKIQRGFGVVMVLIAVAMYFNLDRQFQTFILTAFPQYGSGLTSIETIPPVQSNLDQLSGRTSTTHVNGLKNSGPQAPDFTGGGRWINSQPLTLEQLKGKVVLVDFWTYSCINCIRTLPYLKSWYQTYHDQGLVIVGVHSPEFEFEKNYDNVLKASKDFGIIYPIVQDNDFAIWQAYNNNYWPAHYLIDAQGKIRYTHFGEGEYVETENAIRSLLEEAGKQPTDMAPVTEAPAPNARISPETYVGLTRISNIVSSPRPRIGVNIYTVPSAMRANDMAFEGEWDLSDENAHPSPGAALEYEFNAQNVFLVMTPSDKNQQVKVLIDGQPISSDIAGDDVKDGVVVVNNDRLYSLVKLASVSRHRLRLEFLTPGVKVFAFTFG